MFRFFCQADNLYPHLCYSPLVPHLPLPFSLLSSIAQVEFFFQSLAIPVPPASSYSFKNALVRCRRLFFFTLESFPGPVRFWVVLPPLQLSLLLWGARLPDVRELSRAGTRPIREVAFGRSRWMRFYATPRLPFSATPDVYTKDLRPYFSPILRHFSSRLLCLRLFESTGA